MGLTAPPADQLQERIDQLQGALRQLGPCPKPRHWVHSDEHHFSVLMNSEKRAYIEGRFTIRRVEYQLFLYAEFNDEHLCWEVTGMRAQRLGQIVALSASAERFVEEELVGWLTPAIGQALSGPGLEQAARANLRRMLREDLQDLQELQGELERCQAKAAKCQRRSERHLRRLQCLPQQQQSALSQLL